MRVFIAMSSQAFAQMVRHDTSLLPIVRLFFSSTERDQYRLVLRASSLRAGCL